MKLETKFNIGDTVYLIQKKIINISEDPVETNEYDNSWEVYSAEESLYIQTATVEVIRVAVTKSKKFSVVYALRFADGQINDLDERKIYGTEKDAESAFVNYQFRSTYPEKLPKYMTVLDGKSFQPKHLKVRHLVYNGK